MNPQQRFSGTGVALVTPFRNGTIDWADFEKLIEHVISGGVDYLVCLGTTGESVTTTDEEHRQILDFTIKINRGRLPIVAGIFGGNNTAELVHKIQSFNFDGISALLSSNPAYNKPTQEGIYQHYMALAKVSPLPIIIYNVPSRTASNMTAETTLRLAHASEKFIAVKEASDDIYQITQIIKGAPEQFLVLSGDDFMTLSVIAAGGHGVISVIANTLPHPFSSMVKAALQHDLKAAQPLNLKMWDLYKALFAEGNPAGVKAALEHQGICTREVRLPLVPMSETGAKKIQELLDCI
ncbi:MAG: 4-hydroxy-tetrahydrodipicolinate synthase [Lewinellaceae bacterium]|nr:4-hydroxy-tetrahydrodipicolinate synthase [Lewinellaceae bacterium]